MSQDDLEDLIDLVRIARVSAPEATLEGNRAAAQVADTVLEKLRDLRTRE
jgi:hypothetical protein